MCVDGEAGPYRGRGAFYDYDMKDLYHPEYGDVLIARAVVAPRM